MVGHRVRKTEEEEEECAPVTLLYAKFSRSSAKRKSNAGGNTFKIIRNRCETSDGKPGTNQSARLSQPVPPEEKPVWFFQYYYNYARKSLYATFLPLKNSYNF